MIPFTVTISAEQRDKNLSNKLIAENSGILNWLIKGYAMWNKEGLKQMRNTALIWMPLALLLRTVFLWMRLINGVFILRLCMTLI